MRTIGGLKNIHLEHTEETTKKDKETETFTGYETKTVQRFACKRYFFVLVKDKDIT